MGSISRIFGFILLYFIFYFFKIVGPNKFPTFLFERQFFHLFFSHVLSKFFVFLRKIGTHNIQYFCAANCCDSCNNKYQNQNITLNIGLKILIHTKQFEHIRLPKSHKVSDTNPLSTKYARSSESTGLRFMSGYFRLNDFTPRKFDICSCIMYNSPPWIGHWYSAIWSTVRLFLWIPKA